MRPDVVAVIPSYRPDAVDLPVLVETLLGCGVPVVVSDDASPCTADSLLRTVGEACRHRRAAPAQRRHRPEPERRAAARGWGHGQRWLLTVDQDSHPASPATSITSSTLSASADATLGRGRVGAVGAGSIADSSGALGLPGDVETMGIPTTHEVIQTGTICPGRRHDGTGGLRRVPGDRCR